MAQDTFNPYIISGKAALSAVLAYSLYRLTGLSGETWAAVSAVVVIQESLHPSLTASFTRIGANLIGAVTGALFAGCFGVHVYSLGAAVMLTGLICSTTRLKDGIRQSFAGAVIVLLTTDQSVWRGSALRVLAVVIGCCSALLIGLLFHWATKMTPENPQDDEKSQGAD